VPQDETRRYSPKRGTDLPDDPCGGNDSNVSGLEVGQPTLGLSEPEPTRIGVYFLIQAGDKALREAGASPARELQGLRFDFAG